MSSISISAPLNFVDSPSMIYQTESMQAVIPKQSLGSGSLTIQPISPTNRAWTPHEHAQAYALIQRIISVWKQHHIDNYFIFSKQSNQNGLSWDIVPYPSQGWSLWQQIKVLWRIIFGGFHVSESEKSQIEQMHHTTQTDDTQLSKEESIQKVVQDAFCKAETIEKQWVFKGKHINVLYNYAPVGRDKLHFLFVPVGHCETFAELTEEEYVEKSILAEKISQYYINQSHQIIYQFNSNGSRAGQSVTHWHDHLIVTNPQNEFLGQLRVFFKMLFGSRPIHSSELRERVEKLREDLKHQLNEDCLP
jgi:diadenosine tetraphosphate (Ap4A) HIT family hydrolase